MPYYKSIKTIESKERRLRLLNGLDRLRKQLEEEMPQKTREATLIVGTWNIRNFDDNRFGNGPRNDEDLQYIAEIISRFDVIAVQEICDDVRPLDKLMRLLGYHYDYIMTDVTEGKSGNDERLGFIYDKNKVTFKGVAGELVLPDKELIIDKDDKGGERQLQFARTPFMCSFQSGWFKFIFSTVHIYFGESTGAKYERRVKEIDKVAEFLAKRAENDDQNLILVGDFNIEEKGSPGYKALTNKKYKFEVFQNKNKAGSNKDQTKHFDQISFRVRENELRLTKNDNNEGVFQFFKSIYREEDFSDYKEDLKIVVNEKIVKLKDEVAEAQIKLSRTGSQKTKERLKKFIAKKEESITNWEEHLQIDEKLKGYYLDEWRTFHGSDHLPLWVELEIDFSDAYLDYLKTL